MMSDTALSFDHCEVNVDMAQEYLKDFEDDIKNFNLPQVNQKKDKSLDYNVAESMQRKRLADKVMDNTMLMCQLEYLQNNTPTEVTEKNIKLILKYLSLDNEKYKLNETEICLVNWNKYTPLAYLAFNVDVMNHPSSERAAVCYLFAKLCRESGFKCSINYIRNGPPKDWSKALCTGVISERSDVNSAVDAFLSSPSSAACIWRLRRIFVQESILESFKKVLDFKTTLIGTKGSENVDLKKLCSDVYIYGGKVFLIDFAGDTRAPQLDGIYAIRIEAYRTNKELISLIGKDAGILSLWSSDVAEANEIAYNVPASLVWINDYGNFDGPPEICTFLYSHFNFSINNKVPISFFKRHEAWIKYDNKERISIIRQVLERVAQEKGDGNEKMKAVLQMQEYLFKLNFNSVDVADGRICVTLGSPVGFNFEKGLSEEMIHSLAIGNGVVYAPPYTFPLYEELSCAGVPVISWGDLLHNNENENVCTVQIHHIRYRTKVVLTNYGTIFAN